MQCRSLNARAAAVIMAALLLGCAGSGSPASAPHDAGEAGATGTTGGTTFIGGSTGSGASGGSLATGGITTGGAGGSSSTNSLSSDTGGTSTSSDAGGGSSEDTTRSAPADAGTSQDGMSGGTSSPGGTKSNGGTTATGGTVGTGGRTASTGTTGPLPALTVFIAGDSTVSNYTDSAASNDQAGWGQMLHEIFSSRVTVDNRAVGGRTAYWFYLEGAVGKILSAIKPGDYFFIQFGTNDQNETATFTVDGKEYPRYAEADTTFKEQLKKYYLDPTKAKKAIPILVTPPPRNSAYCNGGNGLSAYATAMIELGAAENVAVLDNNRKTFDYLKAICPKPTTAATETFFLGKPDGSIDGTHFQENGARKMAGFIGEEIKRVGLGLAGYLK